LVVAQTGVENPEALSKSYLDEKSKTKPSKN